MMAHPSDPAQSTWFGTGNASNYVSGWTSSNYVIFATNSDCRIYGSSTRKIEERAWTLMGRVPEVPPGLRLDEDELWKLWHAEWCKRRDLAPLFAPTRSRFEPFLMKRASTKACARRTDPRWRAGRWRSVA